LSDDEIVDLVARLHRKLPLTKVRITGGEPLLRPALPDLVARLRALLPEAELCLTTNGVLLEEAASALKQAGLDRLNVSLDTLDEGRFAGLTGVWGRQLVLAGLARAKAVGFEHTRLNAVLLRSTSARELADLVRFAAEQQAEIRFIELMPVGTARSLFEREYRSAAEGMALLCETLEHRADLGLRGTSRRHRFRVGDRDVVVGFITPVSEPFCETCDRYRLDARGRLIACLRRGLFEELAAPLRLGDPDEVDRRIAAAAASKERPEAEWPITPMVEIGG
jgi:cyclic pyranopterin phosphate synthase